MQTNGIFNLSVIIYRCHMGRCFPYLFFGFGVFVIFLSVSSVVEIMWEKLPWYCSVKMLQPPPSPNFGCSRGISALKIQTDDGRFISLCLVEQIHLTALPAGSHSFSQNNKQEQPHRDWMETCRLLHEVNAGLKNNLRNCTVARANWSSLNKQQACVSELPKCPFHAKHWVVWITPLVELLHAPHCQK